MLDHREQRHLDHFLSEERGCPKVIVIYGPTGSGKTAMALSVAHSAQSEIISTDARQIYRHMDIGTGKITKEAMGGIPHHMLDVRDPSDAYSVAEFQKDARSILEDIHKRGKIPILCGGTGLYLDSLIYERGYMGNKPDPDRRRELEQFREQHGNEALWKKLFAIDPRYAEKLHVNNWSYIIRGIEIMEETGRSKLEADHGLSLKYDTLFLTPYTDTPENRRELYGKINLRISQMFATGLVEEVGYIIRTFTSNCPGLATIGYKEVVDFLEGKISLEEAIALVQQHNRNYAKRQITWNKKYAPRG